LKNKSGYANMIENQHNILKINYPPTGGFNNPFYA